MNKQEHIRQTTEALFVQGNLDFAEIAFSPHYSAHAGNKTWSKHKFIKQYTKQLRRAIADINIQKIECLSQAEYIITTQRFFSGTHVGELKGIAASHKKVKWIEMVVTRFEDNKIAEEWISSDLALQLMLKHRIRHKQ